LSGFLVTPSTFQVTEGESLTTSLTGFTPGSTVYFKVGGRGVSKKDFAAGGAKGSAKVGADGVASISHTLRADKATEGDESFEIQVFSDKKMRNLLGQSDAVTVFDTSTKAAIRRTGATDRGNTIGKGTKDAITGLSWQTPGLGEVRSDEVIRLGPKDSAEIELSKNYLAYTSSYLTDYGTIELDRIILMGDLSFDRNGRLESLKILAGASNRIELDAITKSPLSNEGTTATVSPSAIINDATSTSVWQTIFNTYPQERLPGQPYYKLEGSKFTEGGTEDFRQIQGFGEGKFFYDGWWTEPFATNLI
jgi:hypothetical protein